MKIKMSIGKKKVQEEGKRGRERGETVCENQKSRVDPS